jgi:hypothetical protein
MNDREQNARERLLRVAHDVIGEEIRDRLPGPTDDASAEYNEERLISAARKFVEETRERGLLAHV